MKTGSFEALIGIVNKPNAAPGDYTGADGLLHCGKCRKPKQMRLDGVEKPVSILCDCAEDQRRMEEAQARQKRVDDLRARCLPREAMRRHTFEVADVGRHIDIARRFVEKWPELRRNGTGLALWGNVGTGKSFTAHCIANALIEQEIPVRCTSAAEIVAALTERNTPRAEYLDRLCSVPLLVIDDLGAERGTDYAREQLCAAIDARTESGRPFVVTTNYSLEEMRNPADPALARIFDRVLSRCVPVAVVGKSRREDEATARLAAARALLEDDK